MSDRVVLDASAMLAFLQDEPGARTVEKYLTRASMSTVNWAEVVQKLHEVGVELNGLRDEILGLGLDLVPLEVEDAELAGMLRKQTRSAGLSLGDRACLALATRLRVRAVTADRDWLKVRQDVIVIR